MTGMETATIELTGALVEPAQVVAVAHHGAPARLSDAARAMAESAEAANAARGCRESIYGVSTGWLTRRDVDPVRAARGAPAAP